jgi:PilZ domain
MVVKRRQSTKRAHRRVEVRYGPQGPQHIGYSGNVSRTGIMIRAIRVFPPGTVLSLELKFPDSIFKVCGEVVWAREGSVQLLSTGRVGMGVTFREAPPDLLEYLDRMSVPR